MKFFVCFISSDGATGHHVETWERAVASGARGESQINTSERHTQRETERQRDRDRESFIKRL